MIREKIYYYYVCKCFYKESCVCLKWEKRYYVYDVYVLFILINLFIILNEIIYIYKR